MTRSGATSPPTFDRRSLAEAPRITRIGDGAIGGKASGLWRIQEEILPRLAQGVSSDIEADVPTMTVVTTELFDSFVERNGLDEESLASLTDDRIAHQFQRCELPAEHVGDLRALVRQLKTPVAVRSSSQLEDALDHPFAGVYGTKMIPNNQHDPDTRFRRLVEAIKFVYASTFFAAARAFRRVAGQPPGAEAMAVVIQEIVGRRSGDRFYPTVSAVARSYNHYPTGHGQPADGVISLALGLGKTIVDGGVCWTYCPRFPKAPPPYGSTRDLLHNTQTRFWAVHMGKPPLPDPIRETEYLREHDLTVAEDDDRLRDIASTYDGGSDRVYPGIGAKGPRVLDFGPALHWNDPPINEAVRRALAVSEEVIGEPVEIELALDMPENRGEIARLGFLQVRPMRVEDQTVTVSEDDLSRPGVVVASENVLGNGRRDDLTDVVYLKPETFDRAKTRLIAAQLERVDAALAAEGREYVLIGFGRWGSSDPWLGVPVVWGQVSGARVIVETTLPELAPELSQGSHFFHNLLGFRILYLSVRHAERHRIAWDWLAQQPAAEETEFVRHVRLARPLSVRVDGFGRRGVIGQDV